MKLYELNTMYQEFIDLVEENQDLDEEIVRDTLDSIKGALHEKVESVAIVIKTLEAEAEAFKAEEKRLSERRKARENEIRRLKNYLEYAMKTAGEKKVKGKLYTINIQKNPPSINLLDDKKIPEKYRVPQPAKLDKKQILADLKKGIEVEGCLIEQTEGARIR